MSVPSLPMFLEETRFRFHEVAQTHFEPDISDKHTAFIKPTMSLDTSLKKPSRGSGLEARRGESTTKEEVTAHGTGGRARKHQHHHHNKARRRLTSSVGQAAVMSAHQDTLAQTVPAEKENDAVIDVPLSTLESQHHLAQLSQSILDSGFQHTTSDKTVHRKDENIVNLQLKLSVLTKKYKDVERERDDLKGQLIKLSHKQEVLVREKEKCSSLEAKNRELSGDIVILKNLVYCLNVELERYQQKYQESGEVPPGKPASVDGKEAEQLWSKINKQALVPLLDAYSETIKEKDDLIHSYEVDLNKFVANCKNVVAENEKLHKEVEELRRKQESVLLEGEVLRQDAALAQEQSQVLADQVQLHKDKLHDISTSCQLRIGELLAENDALKEKYHQCRGDLLTAQGTLSVLREEYDNLKKDLHNKVPFSVHTAAVSECRRLLDELKAKYEVECGQLSSQLAAVQSDYAELQVQHAAMKAETKHHHLQLPNLERLLKKSQQHCEDLQRRMVSAQVSRDATKRQLQKAMSFAEELVAEQERLLGQLYAKQNETKTIAHYNNSINSRMNTLRSKIKTVKKVAFQDLHIIEKRIKEQESSVELMKDEYHNEVARLRNLIRHKEAIISRLQREKCKTEEELEVVWRAATSEDACVKEKMKRVHIVLPEPDQRSASKPT